MGEIGYHAFSIPSYVTEFDLRGMIVVAKDDPIIELKKVEAQFPKQIEKVDLMQMGYSQYVGIVVTPKSWTQNGLGLFRH